MKDPSAKVKLSTLDAQAPPDVQVMLRFSTPYSRGATATVLADFTDLAEAQAFAQKLTRGKQRFTFFTWWQRNGRHVHKWPTLMQGKRRSLRVSLPYVPGISDEMTKVFVLNAILQAETKPKEYTADTIAVRVDSEANKAELAGFALVQMAVSPAQAESLRAMPMSNQAELIERGLRG